MTNPENSGWVGNWAPSIGDPTIIGWLTVGLYAIAAILCHRAAHGSKAIAPRKFVWQRESVLWQVLAYSLWFLCINKQLDLQTAMTELGRILARQQGWYANRHLFQEALVAGLLLAGFFGVSLLLIITWHMSRSLKFAMIGFCFIGVFILIRASTFNHVGRFLGRSVLAIDWSWILEIGGITLVIVAASRWLNSTRNQETRSWISLSLFRHR
jgi:hypothetical protein